MNSNESKRVLSLLLTLLLLLLLPLLLPTLLLLTLAEAQLAVVLAVRLG